MEFTFIGPEWGDDAEGGGDENGGEHGDHDGEKGENGAAAAVDNSGDGEERKPKSASQLEGEEMVGELVAATEGLMCTMEVFVVISDDIKLLSQNSHTIQYNAYNMGHP